MLTGIVSVSWTNWVGKSRVQGDHYCSNECKECPPHSLQHICSCECHALRGPASLANPPKILRLNLFHFIHPERPSSPEPEAQFQVIQCTKQSTYHHVIPSNRTNYLRGGLHERFRFSEESWPSRDPTARIHRRTRWQGLVVSCRGIYFATETWLHRGH